MHISPVVLAIVAILVGIAGITTNAIGINDIKPKEHPKARSFLIINLIINIVFVLGGVGYLWMSFNSGSVATKALSLF
jgi:hypothetical protein